MKGISIVMISLLLTSIFAVSLSLIGAQEIEVSNLAEEIPTIDSASVVKIASDELSEKDSARKIIGLPRITTGHGWATSENSGYVLNTFWIIKSISVISPEDIRVLKEKYKDDIEGYQKALKALVTKEITEGKGKITIGSGKNAEHLEMQLIKATDNEVSFQLYNGKIKESVGNLSLTAKKYSAVTIWNGELKLTGLVSALNNPKLAGSYEVSIATTSLYLKGEPALKDKPISTKKESKPESSIVYNNSEKYAAGEKQKAFEQFQKERAENAQLDTEESNSAWARFLKRIFGK